MTNGEIIQACGDRVWASINGHDRGDGYDVEAYRLGSRYLVRVYYVRGGRSSWYTASTLEGARAVGAAGWTPGGAPGAYRYVSDPSRLAELRESRVERQERIALALADGEDVADVPEVV
jgi:hypothetical protein